MLANPFDSEILTTSGQSWGITPSYGRDSLVQHGLGLLDRGGWSHCGNTLLSCDLRARLNNLVVWAHPFTSQKRDLADLLDI